MPRGIRKNGQFVIKVWVPNGPTLEWCTTRDLSCAEWCKSITVYANELLRIADMKDRRAKAEESTEAERAVTPSASEAQKGQ